MLSSVSVTTERTSAWPALAGGPQFVAIDSNGNLTSKVEDGHSWTYEWNAENQLKRVLKDAVEVARYAYDPAGRRVEKTVGAVSSSYVYDHEDIAKQVSGGSPVRYVHGPGFDEPLAIENAAGQLTYVHADGLGSELKQTDATGAVVFTRSYDAFGKLQSGATNAGYAFTSREWDPETQLQYSRARYYDPVVGRFVSADPLGFAAGPNFYAYVRNNPARWRDPKGLNVGALATAWGIALAEPTPIGEVVMTVVTVAVVATAAISQVGDRCQPAPKVTVCPLSGVIPIVDDITGEFLKGCQYSCPTGTVTVVLPASGTCPPGIPMPSVPGN